MRTVIITGSSRGIGLACAHRFASEGGWNIILNSRSEKDLEKAASELSSYEQTSILPVCGDVSDKDFIKTLFYSCRTNFGSLDVLINNAGIDRFNLLQDTSPDEWDEVLNINLKSAFLTMREAIPLMLQKHSGSVVNVSSVWGNVGGACEAAYSASKGGLNTLTKAAAQELAPSGIRVNAAAFGAIDTLMNARLSDEEVLSLTEEIPLGRMGRTDEAAELIYDLAVRYTYMTGQIVTMDGGWTNS